MGLFSVFMIRCFEGQESVKKIIHLVDTEIKREMLFFDSLTLSCIMHKKVNIVCIGVSTTPHPSKTPPSWMHEKVNHSVHWGINHPPTSKTAPSIMHEKVNHSVHWGINPHPLKNTPPLNQQTVQVPPLYRFFVKLPTPKSCIFLWTPKILVFHPQYHPIF